MEWLLGFIVKWIIGERLFIGLVLAATIGGAAYFAFMRMRSLAVLTTILGLSVTGFLIGLNVANYACDRRVQAIEDRLQEEVDKERKRQTEANDALRELQLENTRLTERASAARVQTVREIRREIRPDPNCRPLTRAKLDRLRELSAGRRKPVGSGN